MTSDEIVWAGKKGYTTVTCAGIPSAAAGSYRSRKRPTIGSTSGTGTISAVSVGAFLSEFMRLERLGPTI
jgi:hypothetical protein